MNDYSGPVLSALLSNLAKAAEKQQNYEDSAELSTMSTGYWEPITTDASLPEITTHLEEDLQTGYTAVTRAADEAYDDGARRCVKWGEKVTTIQKSLIGRYESKGEDLFGGKQLYICEACGFIALGTDAPEICPVCKAPSSRFSRV